MPYRGFLYFGLMLTADGPKVIEYNCRFGDPECQAVMPLVSGDLAGFCLAGAKGELKPELLKFDEGWSVCVVLASAGYPASSRSGDLISRAGRGWRTRGSITPGPKRNAEGGWETNGGRVLAVVAGGAGPGGGGGGGPRGGGEGRFPGSQRRGDIGRLHFD